MFCIEPEENDSHHKERDNFRALMLPDATSCGSVSRPTLGGGDATVYRSGRQTNQSKLCLVPREQGQPMRQTPSLGLTVRTAMIWIALISVVMALAVAFGERTPSQTYSAIPSANDHIKR